MTLELETWASEWSAALGPALEQAIAAVAGQRPSEDIVGVGIATDADATSIVAVANSRANLDRMIAEDPDFALDSTWHLGEWDLDITGCVGSDPLASTRASAGRGMRRFPPSDAAAGPGEFRMRIWESVSQAMAASAALGYFDRWPHAVRVFLPLDADVPEHRIAAWNAAIQEPAGHEQFRRFLQLDGR